MVLWTKKIYGLKETSFNNDNYLALEPSIIKPNNNAFQNSETYFSYSAPKFRSDILVISVGTEFNDAVKRYTQTCNKYGFSPIILGLNTKWRGGNMIEGIGGGQKINLLVNYLKKLKKDTLIVFTDSYDVIANNNVNLLIDTYKKIYKNKIVFGAECGCWPDETLSQYYPKVNVKNKYLNSGNFIGWSNDILKIIDFEIKDEDDDQLFYTMKYLYSLKDKKNICLDYSNNLFLCLNSYYDYRIDNSKSCLITNNKNRPFFIHGNGAPDVKRRLNRISNYCVGGWNSIYTYKNNNLLDKLPNILIIYDTKLGINEKTKKSIETLNYPKESLNYFEIPLIESELNNLTEKIQEIKCDYLFYINSNIIIENNDVLLKLIIENKSVISPLLVEKGETFSNFWGDIDKNNFYKRSDDYLELLHCEKRGVWNVPYIAHCFLMKCSIYSEELFLNNIDKGEGMDMAMCYNLRRKNIFMWMINMEHYGYFVNYIKENENETLIELDRFVKSILREDFLNNPKIEKIGENILKIPIFKEEFCVNLIEKCNNFAEWSKGGEQYFDKRIGNTENYPTKDIHLHQIGIEGIWNYIVDKYISKIVWNIYKYGTKDINISFVVKYSMDGQKDLKAHHDSSTYTVNVCLNNEFEGGGCKFIHQDKTIVNKDIGTMIIHPGKLTHYHEGIPITNGQRYVLISFIN